MKPGTRLPKLGLNVLYDDRDENARVKLKDADLIGVPNRAVIRERKFAENKVEFRRRSEATSQDVPISDVLTHVRGLLK